MLHSSSQTVPWIAKQLRSCPDCLMWSTHMWTCFCMQSSKRNIPTCGPSFTGCCFFHMGRPLWKGVTQWTKRLETLNMEEGTVEAHRLIYDVLQKYGGIQAVPITNITGINPEAFKRGDNRYDRLLCPGLQPGPPSQTPGGLGQGYWSVSAVTWPPKLELRRLRSSGPSSLMKGPLNSAATTQGIPGRVQTAKTESVAWAEVQGPSGKSPKSQEETKDNRNRERQTWVWLTDWLKPNQQMATKCVNLSRSQWAWGINSMRKGKWWNICLRK